MKTVYAITTELKIEETTTEKMLKSKKTYVNVCETHEQADRWIRGSVFIKRLIMKIKTLKNRAKLPHYNDAGHPQEGGYMFTDKELYEYTRLVCKKQRSSDAKMLDNRYMSPPSSFIKGNKLVVNINDFDL